MYSELDVVNSELLREIINLIFKGDSEKDYAEKEIKINKSKYENILYLIY